MKANDYVEGRVGRYCCQKVKGKKKSNTHPPQQAEKSKIEYTDEENLNLVYKKILFFN